MFAIAAQLDSQKKEGIITSGVDHHVHQFFMFVLLAVFFDWQVDLFIR